MNFYRYGTIQLALLFTAGALGAGSGAHAEDFYGPVNLVKTLSTPFGLTINRSVTPEAVKPSREMEFSMGEGSLKLPIAPPLGGEGAEPEVKPITISQQPVALLRRSLSDRLVQSRLYLPGRMVLGRTAEFTIKGRPGYYVALAMADKDSGARAVYGHNLRLGSDRKLVSVGVIPEDGILHLVIETPIEGDLIGQNLYFEAAVWSRPDFSYLEIASPVSSEGQVGVKNGVLVAAEPDAKRGVKFVPETTMPSQQIVNPSHGLDSGRP